jgi:thioesterase domain-containing protein
MGLRVMLAEPGCMRVSLPLAPNRNPHGTLFGGALAAVGLATGWLLLHTEIERAGLIAMLVGQRGDCEFLAPGEADCIAESRVEPEPLAAFIGRLRNHGRARMTLETVIRVGEQVIARHAGTYVALPENHRR